MLENATALVFVSQANLYINSIVERLQSFGAKIEKQDDNYDLELPFGSASIQARENGYQLVVNAPDTDSLARLKELLAVAIEVHAKSSNPAVQWSDSEDGQALAQLRIMTVHSINAISPSIFRVRLHGDNLARFGDLGGLHVRLLFPHAHSKWPKAGPNGLPAWPEEPERPHVRVYTIRRINIPEGWVDIDIVYHGEAGIGGNWARTAKPGDQIGMLGPVGRPVRSAQHYIMGADETGLPALARIIERLDAEVSGTAFIEVADERERQNIQAPPSFTIEWLYRDGKKPGERTAIADRIIQMPWADGDCFGWFAGEHHDAHLVRTHWRESLGLTRDCTLVAGYWKLGTEAVMTVIR